MKLKPRIKKIIAMLLIALTINTSIFSAAVIPVQASTIPFASEFVAALLQVFGYTWGLGTTAEGMNNTNSEMFAEMQAKWNAGESFEVDGTEIPDLRVAENFTNFVYDSYDFYNNYNGHNVTNEYMTQLNEKAYKASGTLVTKTFFDALAEAKSYVSNTTSDVLTAELETAFSALTDDDAEISGMNTLSLIFGTIVAGIAAKSQVDAANTWTNTLDTSIWNASDIYKFTFSYDGYDIPCYRINSIELDSTNDTDYIFKADKPVYFMPLKNGGSTYLYCANDVSFVINRHYKNPRDAGWQIESNYGRSYITDSLNCYFVMVNNAYSIYDFFEVTTTKQYENLPVKFRSAVAELCATGVEPMDSINSIDSSVTDAMSAYGRRDVTRASIVELANTLESRAGTAAGTETAISELAAAIAELASSLPETGTSSGTGEYSSILDKILAAITAIAAAIWGFFSEPLAGIKSAIDIFPAILEEIGSIVSGIPKTIWEYVEPSITAIQEKVTAIVSQNTKPWDEDNTERSNDSLNFFNGLFLLILIIIKLLQIFWHCLQFIVAIFEIPPSTAFLPDEVISGLHYIKAIEITGIGMSVYDFMMGLIYIIIIFSVIRVLRKNVDRIHIPGSGVKKG